MYIYIHILYIYYIYYIYIYKRKLLIKFRFTDERINFKKLFVKSLAR